MLAGRSLRKPEPSGVETSWDMDHSSLAEPRSPAPLHPGLLGRERAQLGERGPGGKEEGLLPEPGSDLLGEGKPSIQGTVWRGIVTG